MNWWKYRMVLMTVMLFSVSVSAIGMLKNDSINKVKQAGEISTDSMMLLNEKYRLRIEKYERFWKSLIPNQMKIQYAGSIGMVSAGVGWHYGKEERVWETDFFVGYIPKFYTRNPKVSLTLKQSYIPFRIQVVDDWEFEPLSCGMFFNTIMGHQFWYKEPSKYPKRYYGFSTKFRIHVFIGERLRYNIPSKKRRHGNSISLYYELSTCDLYLASYVPNSYLSLKDVLSLSLGAKLDFF